MLRRWVICTPARKERTAFHLSLPSSRRLWTFGFALAASEMKLRAARAGPDAEGYGTYTVAKLAALDDAKTFAGWHHADGEA